MNLPQRLHHSYPVIKQYARSMCSQIHQSRSTPSRGTDERLPADPLDPNESIIRSSIPPLSHTHPRKKDNYSKSFKSKPKIRSSNPSRSIPTGHLSEEQRNLIIEKVLTQTDSQNVLYSEDQIARNNAYICNLVVDMVYTHYIQTGQGIALYDSQFHSKWKKFIVRKFSPIFPPQQLTQIVDKLSVLPQFLSNYTQRIRHFILYEYDRISFKKPVYLYPSDSFMISWAEHSKHNTFNNAMNSLHDERNPYLRKNKNASFPPSELHRRLQHVFSKTKYKNGLY